MVKQVKSSNRLDAKIKMYYNKVSPKVGVR